MDSGGRKHGGYVFSLRLGLSRRVIAVKRFVFLQFLLDFGLMQRAGRFLVLLGDMGTGKTSMVLRMAKGQFYDNQEPTVGAAFFTQILSLAEATVKLCIWDTEGQERYHSLAPMYYCGAAAAVVVYISSMKRLGSRKSRSECCRALAPPISREGAL
ncbi:hypothetical protein CRG98_028893 [Punica granatum]|uniref:Uncharacterized protein n=1 Tax=Punica granatum TaxID=22663 RepID=A0A2I0J3F4_PUNGR|nr:hypothetical protein CRG98_028893 [Punica granatum]